MKKKIVRVSGIVLAAALIVLAVRGIGKSDPTIVARGLIIPRDESGMFLRNAEEQVEVSWTKDTKVALEANTRLFVDLKPGMFSYRIQSSNQRFPFPLPEGPIKAVVTSKKGKFSERMLKEAVEEKWIPESNLRLFFGEKPEKEQLMSERDPRFIGLWDPVSAPRTISILGERYELSLKKGGQASALLFNVVGTDACVPFIDRATVTGKKKDGILIAEEIHVMPIGDQVAFDRPELPRYLFIGDSISGNYNKGLRKGLEGKLNIHHPPANCGPVSKGRANIVEWLGGFAEDEKRRWDVISFNFGHWDVENDKASYQRDLEVVIRES